MKKLFKFAFIALSIFIFHACTSIEQDVQYSQVESTESVIKENKDHFKYLDEQAIKAGIQNRVYIESEQFNEKVVGKHDKYYPIHIKDDSIRDNLNLEISIDNSKDEKLNLMLYFFIEGELNSFSKFEAVANTNSTFEMPLYTDTKDLEEITVVQIDLDAGEKTYSELNASVARIIVSDNEDIFEDESIEVVSRSEEFKSHTYEIEDDSKGGHTHKLLVSSGNNFMNITVTHFTEDGEYSNLTFNEEIKSEESISYNINRIDGKRNYLLIQNNYGLEVISDLKSAIIQDVDYMTTDGYIIEIY
ncbi:hypothetical protein [Shouchella miscanthi]|uniref:Lipoprotein n=1 Tax=Shouchella miscanthi TaxID=2598861 RepID=A0ABU6NNQ8_9BACI|nr:hypothetical protein [Shouchella miscanthi]MED4129835.1 hypothetical protein [Shouchella miscanthi]